MACTAQDSTEIKVLFFPFTPTPDGARDPYGTHGEGATYIWGSSSVCLCATCHTDLGSCSAFYPPSWRPLPSSDSPASYFAVPETCSLPWALTQPISSLPITPPHISRVLCLPQGLHGSLGKLHTPKHGRKEKNSCHSTRQCPGKRLCDIQEGHSMADQRLMYPEFSVSSLKQTNKNQRTILEGV